MKIKIWLGFLIVSLVLMSCSLTERAFTAPSSSSLGEVPLKEIVQSLPQKVTNDILSKAETDLRQAVREQGRSELGDEADALFQKMDAAYAATVEKLYNDVQNPSRFGLQQGGTLLGVSIVLATLPVMVSKMADGTKTETVPPLFDSIKGDGKLTVTKSGSKIIGDIEVPLSMQSSKGAYSETATGKIEMDLCPDADGGVDLKISLSFKVQVSGTQAGNTGSLSIGLTIDGTLAGKVNDEAELASIDYNYKVGNARTAQGSASSGVTNSYVEIANTFTFIPGRNGTKNQAINDHTQVTRTSSQATGKDVSDAANAGNILMMQISNMIMGMAEALWSDGFCVEILVDGAQESNQVAPSATDDFTARVKHKWEGIELPAGIKAALGGEKRISPNDKQPAPVNYVYTAGDKDNQEATVTLETRSKRGAAKKTLSFKTQTAAWSVTGQLGEMTLSGQICGTGSPFTLKAVPLNVPLEFSFAFIPDSPSGGTIEISGGGPLEGGSMYMNGSGTYHFEGLDGDSPLLVGDVQATLKTSGAGMSVNTSHDGSFRFPMTQIDAASCGK